MSGCGSEISSSMRVNIHIYSLSKYTDQFTHTNPHTDRALVLCNIQLENIKNMHDCESVNSENSSNNRVLLDSMTQQDELQHFCNYSKASIMRSCILQQSLKFAQTEGKNVCNCELPLSACQLLSRLKHNTSYIIHPLEAVVAMTTEMCAPT